MLLALCKSAHRVAEPAQAEQLFARLCPYLLEAHEQAFAPSPRLAQIEPSPWEALSFHLASALLALARRHAALRRPACDALFAYLQHCLRASSGAVPGGEVNGTSTPASGHGEALERLVLAMSLVGFLDAAAAQTDVFHAAERLALIQALRTLLSNDFMIAFEGALSSIRTSEAVFRASRELRAYAQRYTRAGRPLGAMLLQHGFLKLLVSASALQVAPAAVLREQSILDYLMEPKHLPLPARQDYDYPLVNLAAEIADEAIRTLDDGADYLELASAWQQHLALRVRGQALTVLLNGVVADEDADADALLALLEASLADPLQMENDALAATTLKSLVVLAKASPVTATALARSMPRFIVQGRLQGATVLVAARCLAAILQMISPDAVITGLYSLGNVLSAPSVEARTATLGSLKKNSLGGTIRGSTHRYTQHSTGSAISLGVSGDEETFAVYANVVRAIVGVAIASDDERITSLAQSMLIQKLGRIDLVVDLQIIVETASLGATGTESDLKSLLKLYDKLGHDAAINNNEPIQDGVSSSVRRSFRVLIGLAG